MLFRYYGGHALQATEAEADRREVFASADKDDAPEELAVEAYSTGAVAATLHQATEKQPSSLGLSSERIISPIYR